MPESSNSVVRNALASGGMSGAAEFLAGFAISEKLRKENEERKSKARGSVIHAVKDLNGALGLFDSVAKSGDPVASAASQSVSQSIGLLSRLLSSV